MRLLLVFLFFGGVFGIVNLDVQREIKLTTDSVRTRINVEVGDLSGSKYQLKFPETYLGHIAKLRVKSGESELQYTQPDAKKPVYEVDLPTTTTSSIKLKITLTLVDLQKPLPKKIKQNDNQLMVYSDNIYFLSPYTTKTQTTVIKLPSSKLEDYTKKDPHAILEDKLTYGEYKNVAAGSQETLRVHYQSNVPFVKATTLKRTLQVSHWGVLGVEEQYKLVHTGAEIDSFSRLEFMGRQGGSPSAVRFISALIPERAQDIYYRDAIGNISTSHISRGGAVETSKIQVDFLPRFPLFGGWQTNFYFGFNLPLDQVLTSEGSYELKYPLASPIKNLHVENLETSIQLPEGASNVEVTVGGKKVPNLKNTLTPTYLDTTGRVTVSFSYNNIVNAVHTDEIVVKYDFSVIQLLHEPLLLTGAFFVLFVVRILFVRLF